jgi:hypothetical protein
MHRKKIIIGSITLIVSVISYFVLHKLSECYPGFQPMFKTPGDGCDLADFIQRIGILPYILILFLGVFIYVFDQKREKRQISDADVVK